MFAVTCTDVYGINYAKSFTTLASASRKYNKIHKEILQQIKDNPKRISLHETLVLSSSENALLKTFKV